MYKITIIKEEVKKTREKEYEKVADTGNERDDGPIYDYVWSDSEEKVDTTLYTQRTDSLDLKAVIDAVNKGGDNAKGSTVQKGAGQVPQAESA